MRVIMTGGGTGGHIYPAVAIADKIRDEKPDAEIMFVGTERGLEKTLVPQSGYPIRFITVSGINRKKLLKNLKVIMDFQKGTAESEAIIKEFKPDIVIGTGGYVCAPVVKAAKTLGVRSFIHEQNASPGLTNRILERYAEKVFLGFEEAGKKFRKRNKLVFSGNPVRKSFFNSDKTAARAELGIADGDFAVISFGGSRGAAKLNEVMLEVSGVLSGIENFSFFFVTGSANYDKILSQINNHGMRYSSNIHILPYLDKMEKYLPACDVVISRAGALTVSEIAVCGKPAILVPSPNVTGNHQLYNAKALASGGGALLVEEKDLSADGLIETLMKMRNDKDILTKMALACGGAAKKNAVQIIYDNLGI